MVIVVLIWIVCVYVIKQKNNELIRSNMKITSQTFEDGGNFPSEYTCLGDGVNPPLDWSQVPSNTKSLALIVDDPDAPDGIFTHWVVWNISPEVEKLSRNSVPFGAMVGVGSSGEDSYFAPCPPSGAHHYRFKLYALDTKLSLLKNSGQVDLEKAMVGHILDQAILIGLFKK